MKTLGKYQILDTLGKGGFATVFLARDPDLERNVALKVMDPLLMRDPLWVKRFRQEARAIAQLKHPHIITIYEIGQADGVLFIAMQLAEQGSLEDRLQQGPLPWEQTLELAGQMAAALDHAHARGIVHRDLKPANILLDSEIGVILTDFGFARLVADHSLSVTMSGGMVGTPSYIPPEVWKGTRADKPADIYAFGAILYEMITGHKRFDAPTAPAVMMAHFSPPPWPETWPEDTPPEVVEVLARAMAQTPEERYESAGALLEDLLGLTIDRLAEPYAELEAAMAAHDWREALALVDRIKASDPSYRDVEALEQRALAGLEEDARRTQAQQWQQAVEEALAAGNVDAAELALMQWAGLEVMEEERQKLLGRLQELKQPATPQPRHSAPSSPRHSASSPPRPLVTLEDWMIPETVLVPAGKFLMGSEEADLDILIEECLEIGNDSEYCEKVFLDEVPQHWVFLEDFHIAKYPVTVAQFEVFVFETGYVTTAEQLKNTCVILPNEIKEISAEWRHPFGNEIGINFTADHPVTQVSLIDAKAYCQWLSKRTGQNWRLPSEEEWEKAARGIDGREYPWGNHPPNEQVCNFMNNIGRTTPVNQYPEGISPYGVFDMSGNVFEWTISSYKSYLTKNTYQSTTPNTPQRWVLRGGSWNDDKLVIRAAFRDWDEADYSDNLTGFRCMLERTTDID